MARPLRIQFPGAIYHVMARGNGRQQLFHEECDYQRMTDGLQVAVGRTAWEVLAFVWMPNHIHLFFRTPRPDLSKGMQYLLSGYANWYAKRHRRTGHLFQGRFKGELIEDESYFWTVSRYVHLNPVRGTRPLAKHPADWPWSSYRGYARRTWQTDFVDYQSIWTAWQGESGGKDPARAYRRYVEAGQIDAPPNPFRQASDGWLLGSQAFIERIREKVAAPGQPEQVRQARRLAAASPDAVIRAVAAHHGVAPAAYCGRRSTAPGRDLAAYLAHRRSTATLRELAAPFGLRHPDSVSNLIRRAEKQLAGSPGLRKTAAAITQAFAKTENRI